MLVTASFRETKLQNTNLLKNIKNRFRQRLPRNFPPTDNA